MRKAALRKNKDGESDEHPHRKDLKKVWQHVGVGRSLLGMEVRAGRGAARRERSRENYFAELPRGNRYAQPGNDLLRPGYFSSWQARLAAAVHVPAGFSHGLRANERAAAHRNVRTAV